jgi:hypothetical protein
MANRYRIVEGQFPCHICKEIVKSLRFYQEDKLLTWMCSKKHLSEVSLNVKKSKKDYERKVGE